MNVYLTSDTHANHDNIIRYCDRPFHSANEMNHALVNNWNSRIKDDDLVIHLGDLSLGNLSATERFVSALRGRKVLVRGNHDPNKVCSLVKSLGWFVIKKSFVVGDVLFIHDPPDVVDDDISFIVHGHHHGKLPMRGRVDLGVDPYRFFPVNALDVLDKKTAYLMARIFSHGK